MVSQVKLIAEPWDVGEGGYQVGNFPPLWTEWNGKYRDTVRDFWRGEPATLRRVRLPAHRLVATSTSTTGRRPVASINFVTAHDGFTLRDLVSYNDKHNEANGEDNRDGESHNRSWNCGVEGPTDDPDDPRAARPAAAQLPGHAAAVARACRCCSHGDELGRTQHGNNNAYCQDNEIVLGRLGAAADEPTCSQFTRAAGPRCARDHPVFRRRRFFAGGRSAARRPGSATSPGSPRPARR